ncbi:MAG: hypothetical protein K8S15_03820 [Candidatus Aegiribacteria sp.]|nr:hypothetical protein [Candidatus Aegiribacteria sp.]
MNSTKKKAWIKWLMRTGILLLITAAAWIIIVNGENWLEQINKFSWQPVWLLICTSTLFLVISYFLIPAGWIILSHRAGSTVSSRELRAAWFLSQLGRYVPGKVWLFAGRVAFLKSRGLTGYRATSVPFLELLYTVAGAGLAAVIPVVVSRSDVFSHSGLKYAVLAAGISLLVIPFLTPIQKWLYRLKYGRVPQELPLPGLIGSIKLLLIYSAISWLRGLALFLWLKGFGISDVSFLLCCAAVPLSWLAGYIVFVVPGGIGVKEAATVALLAPSGATGPVLAVITGQRLISSIIEVSLALVSTRTVKIFGKEK